MGGPCGTNRGLKMHIEFWCLNVNRRDRSEDSRTGEGEAVTENGGGGVLRCLAAGLTMHRRV